jgi:hypothetical protein
MKAAPYALGGLVGGSLLNSMFSSGSGKKKSTVTTQPLTTQGTVGPAPAGGSY